MIGVLGSIFDAAARFIELGWWTLAAYGGAGGAFAAFIAMRFQRVPAWLGEAVIAALVGLSCISFGWLWRDGSAEMERYAAEIERWKAVVQEQARQREAYQAVAREAQADNARRIRENETLNKTVADYEAALSARDKRKCDPDPDYPGWMRSIRIGAEKSGSGRGQAKPAAPAGGP